MGMNEIEQGIRVVYFGQQLVGVKRPVYIMVKILRVVLGFERIHKSFPGDPG
jgi:hypothetical protein